MKYLLIIAALFSVLSIAHAQDVPAELNVSVPVNYPAACEPDIENDAASVAVTAQFDTSRRGKVENARIVHSSNACFNDAVLASVRTWRYKPRKVNGVPQRQDSHELTFRFVLDEPTKTEKNDFKPIERYEPSYPQRCAQRAKDFEQVLVEYDILPSGVTGNMNIVETTYPCLNSPSLSAVKKWIYAPKKIDGENIQRSGVRTLFTYRLANESGNNDPYRVRRIVAIKLDKIDSAIKRKKPIEPLYAELDAIEDKFGDTFSAGEVTYYHFIRAQANMRTEKYREALDNFRIVRVSKGPMVDVNKINKAIAQLEAYIVQTEQKAIEENQ